MYVKFVKLYSFCSVATSSVIAVYSWDWRAFKVTYNVHNVSIHIMKVYVNVYTKLFVYKINVLALMK